VERLKFVKILLIMALTLSAVLVFSQQENTIKPNGYNIFYYENGNISSEGNMRNGKPDGYWKNYYENAVLKSEGNRKEYLLDSVWKFYDEEGKLNLEITYKHGKKNGFRTTYQENEILKDYFVDDVKQNTSLVLFPNGSLKLKIPFIDGLEEGLAREYDTEGNIIQLITYKKGYIIDRERINRYDTDTLPNGKWKWFYEDESIRIEGNFKHGLKNGYFKEYDRNGDLISATKFVNGEKIEKSEELAKLDVRTDYYPSGRVKIVATYDKNGIPEGVRREYDEKGKVEKSYIFLHGIIIGEGIFTDAGLREGFWKEYYPDGKLKASGNYKSDKKVGNWKFYYPNGNLEQLGKFIDGKADSSWVWYYPNGKLLREETFLNGLSDGVMTEYNMDGSIIIQGDYIEGKEEGFWFYVYGDTREEGNYAEGMRNGKWKSFYGDGSLMFDGKFVDDLPNGEHTWYWDNGKIKQQGKYSMGRKNGDWKKYDYDGILFISITYRAGKEVKYDGIDVN
jgi:antitoxin component YwqK of YwqJK toxin-antitoxin module